MKLVGPWLSGFTRRTAITMKLLDIPFEHINLHAYLQAEEVRRYSPMGKVPALVLDDGETLFDSSSIIDYLHEMVGPEFALLPLAGPERRQALRIVGIGAAIYGKLGDLYDESLRPAETHLPGIFEGLTEQALIGLRMLEAATGDGWMVGGKLGQADIMTVVTYQSANIMLMPQLVNAGSFPRLAALAERALQLEPFASTVPAF